MTDEQIARIAHEANRAWCAYNGDTSQPEWDAAPEWQRNSAMNAIVFRRANPNAGDSASHDSWMAEKVAAGWVYGLQKDPNAEPPTHPCIVPFEELPAHQQFKDRLYHTVIHAALAGEPTFCEGHQYEARQIALQAALPLRESPPATVNTAQLYTDFLLGKSIPTAA